jgi:hypothetical protein
MIFLTENIPYTPKMLANELDFEESTVQLALQVLEQLNMVVINQGFFTIAGWDEYQNIEGMEKIREQNRLAQQRSRARRKLLQAGKEDVSGDSHVTVTPCHAPEEDKEKDKEPDIEIREKKTDFQSVVDLYHTICISYPKVRSLSNARKKAISARLKTYSMEDIRTVFENAEGSSFLKGRNDRNWRADFDWLITDKNMAKVLDGNYADRGKRGRKENLPGWFENRELDQGEVSAIQNMMEEDFGAEAEQLRRELQESFGRSL